MTQSSADLAEGDPRCSNSFIAKRALADAFAREELEGVAKLAPGRCGREPTRACS